MVAGRMLRSVERQSALIVRARPYSGEVNRGSGKFGEREHAQEEQYFRQKEREEIAKYRQQMEEAARKNKESEANQSEPSKPE